MRLLVWFMLLIASGCDADESQFDAGPDGSVAPGLRCDALEAEWHAFVIAHQSCARDEDCRTVNRYVTEATFGWSCDLQAGLLAAVHVDAYPLSDTFVDRYFLCFNANAFPEPWTDHSYDAAPPDSPYCFDNRCMVSSPTCQIDFDAAGF